MDSLTQIRLSRDLIDIDSTTGREAEAGEWIAACLERLGYAVTRQPVSSAGGQARINVVATRREPLVVGHDRYAVADHADPLRRVRHHPVGDRHPEQWTLPASFAASIGLVGFLSRRNMIVMFLAAEIMLQGVALSLVAWREVP